MTSDERLVALELRSSRLEQRLSRYRTATMAMALLLIAGVTMAQSGNSEYLTCRFLLVKDAEGKTVVSIGSNENGGRIVTVSPKGNHTTVIGGSETGGSIEVLSPSKEAEVFLGASDDGGGRVVTFHDQDSPTTFSGGTNGGGRLHAFSSEGTPTATLLGGNEKGPAALVVSSLKREAMSIVSSNEGGGVIRTLAPSGSPSIAKSLAGQVLRTTNVGAFFLGDKTQQPLVTIGAGEAGGSVGIRNNTGSPILELGVDKYGGGSVTVKNTRGKAKTLSTTGS
jgi:hypothetical protein